jgi:hypothetical protein
MCKFSLLSFTNDIFEILKNSCQPKKEKEIIKEISCKDLYIQIVISQ